MIRVSIKPGAVQMTAVSPPLSLNPKGSTILMGFEPNLAMFAGFDLARHRTFTEGSPSIQIDINAVQNALQNGFAFDRKTNGEIAVGVRPDLFVDYCEQASMLHKAGNSVVGATLLNRASARGTLPSHLMNRLSGERRRIVRKVSLLSRAANFRQQVLQAYDHRCAATRMQLDLIEAAHILPVASGKESIDHVTNGLALSPTYHRALDRGLIYLGEDYVFRLNVGQSEYLKARNVSGGLTGFGKTLGKIHLPPDTRQWPDVRFIRKANQFRGIRA
jgi:putative restriction endonuclease